MTRAAGRTVHPIEARSYEILRSRADLSDRPPLWRAVAERVIHASADVAYANDLIAAEVDLRQGLTLLRSGAPIVTDVAMVAAGITSRETRCLVADPATAYLAEATGLTRSAAAIRVAYEEVGVGAVWVVGCAPTALMEIISLQIGPALVIGLPVGFVGAVEAKQLLRDSGLPALSNVSEKGGAAVAAAALNALLYYEGDPTGGDSTEGDPTEGDPVA
jgi:precorrin-8X/cobalt-precorrin-8 methylmutase